MSLFHTSNPFQIIPGDPRIVIGAPHNGTRPNVDADLGTGPITLALAAKLGCRAVVVSDLRRTVDVNKNPLDLDKRVRYHAIRYQNEMFRGLPQLLIEIHGHVSGQYALELTTGFDLDVDAPGDAVYLERLRTLKQVLPGILAGRVGQRHTVGIYPLDRDVRNTATNTFTFQKIRRARKLAGLDRYGLHIELNAELRTSKHAKSAAYVDALVEGLAEAICSVFEPLPAVCATIPTRIDARQEDNSSSRGSLFRMIPAPERFAGQSVVILHPDDLSDIGALDGDTVILFNAGEVIHAIVSSSLSIRRGQAAVPAYLRRQVSAETTSKILIKEILFSAYQPSNSSFSTPNSGGRVVVGEVKQSNREQVWISPIEMTRLALQVGDTIHVQGQAGVSTVTPVKLQVDPALPARTVALSRGLMDRLTLTLGEVITIRAENDEM